MASVEELVIRSRDGLALEAQIHRVPDPRGGVVMCHPHPDMGGTMRAPLLDALATAVVEDRWTALRFNFRGVGRSEGESATGEDEVADALGALDVMREEPGPTALVGWSFGGAVAVRAAAAEPGAAGCVAIAPAVRDRPGVTAGLPAGFDPGVPLLVVMGSNDEQVPPGEVRAWAEAIPSATIEEIGGANHFFWARYERLSTAVTGWLDRLVANDPASRG